MVCFTIYNNFFFSTTQQDLPQKGWRSFQIGIGTSKVTMTRVYLNIGMSVITLILKLIRRSSSRRGDPLFQRGIALNHLFDDSLFPTNVAWQLRVGVKLWISLFGHCVLPLFSKIYFGSATGQILQFYQLQKSCLANLTHHEHLVS